MLVAVATAASAATGAAAVLPAAQAGAQRECAERHENQYDDEVCHGNEFIASTYADSDAQPG